MAYEEQLERPSSKLEATDPSLFADLSMENINDGPAETLNLSIRLEMWWCSEGLLNVYQRPYCCKGTRNILPHIFFAPQLVTGGSCWCKSWPLITRLPILYHLQQTSQDWRESASALRCYCPCRPCRHFISKSKVLKNSIQRTSCSFRRHWPEWRNVKAAWSVWTKNLYFAGYATVALNKLNNYSGTPIQRSSI